MNIIKAKARGKNISEIMPTPLFTLDSVNLKNKIKFSNFIANFLILRQCEY